MARRGTQHELSETTVVNCSAEHAWKHFIDNQQMAAWAPHVSAVECDSANLAAGVKRKNTVVIDGESGYTIEHCTAFDEPHRIDCEIIEETFGFAHMLNQYGFTVLFESDNQHTTVTMLTRYQSKIIFAKLMSSEATQQKLKSMMSATLQGFRKYVETIPA